MKLSDKELHYALFCGDRYGQNPLYAAAMADLEDGTLEIEGYVRADHIADVSKKVEEWVKFDPDNPKTHPGEHARVLLSIDGTITCGTRQFVVMAKWRGAEKIHWRPLPKPPVESEV